MGRIYRSRRLRPAPDAGPVHLAPDTQVMRMRLRTSGILGALLLAAAADPAAAGACSLGRFWLTRPSTYFIATALPDTALAGPGNMEFTTERGESPEPRPIHGQLVRVEKLGAGAPEAVAAALRSGTAEFVLVPWAYREDCRTTRWSGSTRWLEPGSRSLLTAELRDPSQWVNGRPTFDVLHAWLEPYPQAYRDEAAPDSALTAEELFTFYGLLPDFEKEVEGAADPYPALAPLFRWAAANPALARRFPAARALEEAYEAVQPCITASGTSPVAGTWRFRVEAEGEPERALYLRTSARRMSTACAAPVRPGDPGKFSPRQAESYSLYLHGAPDEDSIPQENREAWDRGGCGVNSMEVWDSPATPAGGPWEARLEWGILGACFRASEAIRRAVQAEGELYRRGEAPSRTGVFRVAPGGGMTFEQTLRVDGRTLLRLRGERVSPRTLAY